MEQDLGPIDGWVNVAFTSVFAPFTKIEPEEYKRVTEVSHLGYVCATRVALERMILRDRGVIVQVGSPLAYHGIPLQSAYCGAAAVAAYLGPPDSLVVTQSMHADSGDLGDLGDR